MQANGGDVKIMICTGKPPPDSIWTLYFLRPLILPLKILDRSNGPQCFKYLWYLGFPSIALLPISCDPWSQAIQSY